MSFLPGTGVREATAQLWRPRLGVGYVVNAPSQFLGFSGHVLSSRWGGIGLYVDAKLDRDSPQERQNFIADLTVQQVEDEIGDEFFVEEPSWRSINAALLRPVTPELMLYAGAGYAHREIYREYLDPQRERGLAGSYWVEDPDREGGTINALAGAFFRITPRVAIQFGVESAPRGMTVGAAYAIPLR